MVDTTNFNIVPNDDEEQFVVEFGEIMNTGVLDFNELIHRPRYNNAVMTGETNIPVVPSQISELENNLNYQTKTEVEAKIALEATARQQADTQIQGAITALSGDLSNEVSSRATADTALGERITGVSNDLASETAARQGADNNLQSQIDGISASSDVKDVVGTYAELQAYDTSTLGNNDIIKVLQDEMHSDETTYYRWSTTTQTFTLIGEEGPYYTKSATDQLLATKADKNTTYTKTETDNLLSDKQGTLTAGSNISISGNTISATDTTYTAGNGLDLTGTEFSVDTDMVATQSDVANVTSYITDATEYSASATYEVGDYAIHDGGIYQCNIAIVGGEAWNSSHWDIVPSLQEQLDNTETWTFELEGGTTVTKKVVVQ